jgi:hypothetical protein
VWSWWNAKAAVILESTDSTALPQQQADLRRLTERRCAFYQILRRGTVIAVSLNRWMVE